MNINDLNSNEINAAQSNKTNCDSLEYEEKVVGDYVKLIGAQNIKRSHKKENFAN